MEQPIKYSDLIQPDDSITNLIKQLDEANEAYNNIGNSIRAEASRIASAMNTISGATQSGRSATRGYSEDAQKLLKAESDLNFARSETARKIAELNAMKKDEQTITKLTVQLNRAAEGSYEALSAQYSLNKIRLNAMTEEERKNTEQGRKLEAETRDIYDRMNELQKATGKYTLEVGNYEKAVGQMMGTQSRWMGNLQMLNSLFAGGLSNGIKAAGSAVAGFGKQLLALLANPVVAVIAAITAAFLALKQAISSSEENTRALERVLAPFQRILTGIMAVLQEVAGWLLRAVEGAEKLAMGFSRMAERLPVIGKYLRQVNNALDENVRLTRERQELEDMERKYSVQNALMARNAAKFRADAEKTSDPKRRAQLLKMAQAAETSAMYNELHLAKEDLRIKEELAKQSQNDKKVNDDIAAARARVYQVEERFYQRQVRLNSKLRKEQEKMNRSASGGSGGGDDTLAEQQRIADERLAIEQKTEEIRISMIEDDFSREYATIVNNYDQQILALQKKGEKDIELRESVNKQILMLEAKRDNDLADLTIKFGKKQEQEQKKIADDKKKAADEVLRTQTDVINKEADLADLQISNMQVSETEKTDLRIKAEKDRLQKIYDLNVKAGKDMTELDRRLFEEQMKALDQEAQKNMGKRDFFDLVGLNLPDEKKEAITQSFDFAKQQLNDYINAWVEAANKKVELATKEVDSAQAALDAERQARAEGYASNVAYAQKELDMAKKNQEKALREQERAQRAKLLMDSIMQASNLITASTLIWSQLGFPWAIPALAVMWGSFAASKIMAFNATRSGSEQYGEGTVELLQGGSHQSGNDVDLGTKSDGTRRRAEGGEFFAVINKRNSRRFRKEIPDVIHSLNDGTFAAKYMNAYKTADGMTVVEMGTSPDLRVLSDDVSAIREQGERRTYTDSRGTHVIYKNVHRIIKN